MRASIPSSSCSSRASAASGVSPGSRLPPGNSQRPARSRPSVRRLSSTRPRASVMTPATTSTCFTARAPSPASGGRESGSGKLPMAVLVLLAAAAGTRVVAADLGNAVGGVAVVLVVGLGGFLVGAVAAAVGVLELHLPSLGLGLGALLRFQGGDFLFGAHAH